MEIIEEMDFTGKGSDDLSVFIFAFYECDALNAFLALADTKLVSEPLFKCQAICIGVVFSCFFFAIAALQLLSDSLLSDLGASII